MKLVITSDCHGMLSSAELPPADVLILAGDLLPNHFADPDRDAVAQWNDLRDLDDFCGSLSYRHVLLIAGNHDWIFERNNLAARELRNITYLEDSAVEIDGVKFYGSPYQPEFFSWAFNLERSSPELAQVWSRIPEEIDILITHGPPYGILDQPFGRGEHAGCELLLKRINEVRPKLHIFGHIHGSYGQMRVGQTLFVNASLCDERYEPVNAPVVLEVDGSERPAFLGK
jgi:Icc-related predicted phosphoesterase